MKGTEGEVNKRKQGKRKLKNGQDWGLDISWIAEDMDKAERYGFNVICGALNDRYEIRRMKQHRCKNCAL